VTYPPVDGEKCPRCVAGELRWQKIRGKVGEDTDLLDVLNSHRRLCAHLICESLGYLTPLAAANLLKHYVLGREFWCEWVSHLKSQGVRNPTRTVVQWAVRNRRQHSGPMANYQLALTLVKKVLSGGRVEFASWF